MDEDSFEALAGGKHALKATCFFEDGEHSELQLNHV